MLSRLQAPTAPFTSSPRLAATAVPQGSLLVSRARRGSRRRWWSDAWEEGDADGNLDGGSLPDAQQITLFCSDGSIVRLGPSPNPALVERQRQRRADGASGGPLPLPEEQGLCIGSIFSISATNGVDAARRLNLLGFCFSTEQLFETVEDTVLRRGGEVFETRRQLKSGVHETLHMSVAIPLLFGVPPEYERLQRGVIQGGGVIERVQRQWVIY